MFGITLSSILKGFSVLEKQLGEFIASQKEKLEVNLTKQQQLVSDAEALTADQEKAERTLERIKALTE